MKQKTNTIKFNKMQPEAVLPQKANETDSGYDLTILEPRKRFGQTILYGTGIRAIPPKGYYFIIVGRSSISKTGHMLANNIGIIDQTYRGELLIPLIKVDPTAPDLELPMKICQLILVPFINSDSVEISDDDFLKNKTERGDGGFGSTDQTKH